MEKFRIGNDLTVFWAILDDDSQPYDLTGRTVKIFLTHPRGRMEITEDVNIQGNVISWLFRGRQQRYLGVYKLTVEIFSSPSTRVLRRDIDQAFSLVSATLYVEESNGRPQINETGKLTLSTILEVYQIMPIVPQVGPNKNWWVDGVDTGKPSTGMSAYEFAKENGYTGTEAEYAAECLAVPVLNEESRTATSKATTVTEGAIAQLQAVSSYMAEVAAPTIAKAEQATTEATAAAENAADSASRAENEADRVERGLSQLASYMSETVSPAVQSANNAAEEATAAAGDANVAAETANDAATTAGTATQKANKAASDATNAAGTANSAAEAANAAATRAERAIEEFGPAIDNKADLENGKIIASQLPDYILGQVMFGGLIYSNGTITASSNFISKYGNDTNISASEASKYNGVYFIVTGDAVNVTIAGVSQVSTGDWIISVGDSWKKIDNSDAVTSVAGLVGNVNASSLAAALAELADSNSLARKTDLPKKLSDLEIDIEIESDNSEIKEILSTIVDEEGYLYSNGEKVDMRFTRSLLPVGTAIPAKANLNSKAYLKIGKYYCSLNVDAKTITNCPTSEAFSMEVFNPLGTNVDDEDTREYTYRLRVLTAYKTGVQYIQYCATSGTAGSWTYNSWFVVPRTSFSLASSKNGGSAAKGASNRGVFIDSTGTFQQMGYTVGKSVPSNAVFTDTNTKVTAVENHYAPAEDEDQQIDAPDGEVVTGLKRDAAGHVVGVVSVPQSEGGSYDDTAIRNELSKKLESEVVGTTEPTEDFNINAKPMVSVTYAELVELRDNGKLVAGMQYRITDYVTTTAQENTRSAGHQFDVIVTADNENTLNEAARACLHEGDTYFSEAGANLAAWQIWYSLDNDTNRFAWADATNGKGVIYRMIDEWNNDCPYDFKNILFTRYELEAPEEYIAEENGGLWMQQLCNNVRAMFDEGVRSFVWAGIADEDKYWEDDMSQILSYTTGENFAFFTFNTDEDTDASLSGNIHDNKMQLSQTLPNNVFFGNYCHSNSFGNDCNSNSFGNDCYYNSFGNSCYYNSFGNGCNSNSFGENYKSNSFGNGCYYNSFGENCYYNSFGNYCHSNSFGNDCNSNSFGNYCKSNSFGNGCYYNSFGNGCTYNSFGNNCYYNSFGKNYNSNSFGNHCYSNSFGNGCTYNSFGNHCYYNSFGNSCTYNSFGNNSQSNELKSYYRYITFGEGVQYVTLQNDSEGDWRNQVQNYKVANGTTNIEVDVDRNNSVEKYIGVNSAGEVKVFCLADLANL